ncbi:MAG: thiamine pyrophosphate-binding protein [Spirochaetes bacterium]|nr:thiamine pyrophosphate-binding protein [Spirochaetota bacterium]
MALSGGDIIGGILKDREIRWVFTLCGGHISPILTGAERQGIRVIDMRHEAAAVFAADATARLTGLPGVAAVTAGPGVTNTVTALKNAQMAQSPVVVLGGAAATVLRGRGSLQDIDQRGLLRSVVKRTFTLRRSCDIVPVMEHAFDTAVSGVPGPVFVECPIDMLYEEALVRRWYGAATVGGGTLRSRLLQWYLNRHVDRMYSCDFEAVTPGHAPPRIPGAGGASVVRALKMMGRSRRPLLVMGSQSMLAPREAPRLAAAVERLGMPVYLAGMARGLLGRDHPLQMRHRRREALREADLLLLAGMPMDFRLDYGRAAGPETEIIAVNRSPRDLYLNRHPRLAVHGDPGLFLHALAGTSAGPAAAWQPWIGTLRDRDRERDDEILSAAKKRRRPMNPLDLLVRVEQSLGERAVIVADGGDFAATASYILRPRSPLSWLDPGPYGTLGVGAGFAVGAKLCRPDAEVLLLYGDGAAGYSLQEFDTLARHGLGIVALVGNDASWSQIARDQMEFLGSDIATRLAYSDYDSVAEGFGGRGFILRDAGSAPRILRSAFRLAAKGIPVLVNALIGHSDFRKGSISM